MVRGPRACAACGHGASMRVSSAPFPIFIAIVRPGTLLLRSEGLTHAFGDVGCDFARAVWSFRSRATRGRRVQPHVSSVPFSIFHVTFRAGMMPSRSQGLTFTFGDVRCDFRRRQWQGPFSCWVNFPGGAEAAWCGGR